MMGDNTSWSFIAGISFFIYLVPIILLIVGGVIFLRHIKSSKRTLNEMNVKLDDILKEIRKLQSK